VWEGGTRTPFITRWKGRIEPGVSDEVVCTVDLCASVAALTGQTLGDGACLDSLDVLDALLGKPGAKGRDHLVQQDNGSSGNLGFRVGDWKLVRFKKNENTKAVVSKPQDIPPPRPHTLYRLSEEYEANAAQDEQRTRSTQQRNQATYQSRHAVRERGLAPEARLSRTRRDQ
jgi:arylsulfatase A